MTDELEKTVRGTIDSAFTAATAGKMEIAVQAFALARTQALELSDRAKLDAAILREHAAYAKERDQYCALFPKKENASRELLIMGDSLGLPRPDDKSGEKKGAERTYTGMIYEKYADRSVTSLCQRFFTTSEVRQLLVERPDLGKDSDFLLHVGLNDCANRMFLENERIALSFLSQETRELMVDFTRKFRRDIILRLPPHHYVNHSAFQANLGAIIGQLKERNAGRIILTTIILPPARSWPGTPGMNRNFAAYNLDIMNAAHEYGVEVMDFDRHVWQAQHTNVLLPDGMHLSAAGHHLFTAKCDPYLR